MERKFRRIIDEDIKWIGGVCAGIAYCLGISTWQVRLLVVLLTLVCGFPLILYIFFWMFVPAWKEVPEDFEEITGD